MSLAFRLGPLALALSALAATVHSSSTAPSAPAPDQAEQQALIHDLLEAVGPLPRLTATGREAAGSVDRAVLGGERPSAAFAASDVVLQPADVGPNFLVASGGEQLRFGISWRTQNLVRAGKN